MTSKRVRQSSRDSIKALDDESVLQQVFTFVGAGHGLYVHLVAPQWRRIYQSVPLHSIPSRRRGVELIYCTETTLCSAVFSSLARLDWAVANGYNVSHADFKTAGRFADIETLQAAIGLEPPANSLRLKNHVKVALGIVLSGDLNKLIWYYEQSQSQSFGNVCYTAACNGQTAILAWLYQNGAQYESSHINGAAGAGHLHTVEFLYSRGAELTTQLYLCAAGGGSIPVLEWLLEHGCPWDERTCHRAAVCGQLAALKWLRSAGCPWCTEQTLELQTIDCGAVKSHSVEMLQWLHEQGVQFSDNTLHLALNNYTDFNTDVLQYLFTLGFQLTSEKVIDFVHRGTLQQMQWLYEQQCPFDKPDIGIAVLSDWVKDSLAKLKWLGQLQRPYEFNEDTMVAAARKSLESVQYLHSVGCPWNAECCKAAARLMSMHTLEWLHVNGCPWDISTAYQVATSVLPDTIGRFEYLLREGLELTAENLTDILNVAGMYRNGELAKWLRSQYNAAWPQVLGSSNNSPWPHGLVKWAREEGCTSPVAIIGGDLDE